MGDEIDKSKWKHQCRNVSDCDLPYCDCPIGPPREIAKFDPEATRKALKESREQHTVRVPDLP